MRPHPRLPLALLLAIRTHLGRQRALSLVTICAIAASVALATSLEMSSRSAEVELERTAQELAGAAQVEVTGSSLGIPEDLLDAVRGVPGVRLAAPFLEASFRVAREDADAASIHVVGVDLLDDTGVRSYSGELEVADPLRLIAGPDAVIVARALADKLKLGPGDTLPVRSGGKSYTLTVRGVLAPKGIAQAYGGQIAIMDVYTLQTLLGREGWLDRIDVVLESGASPGEVSQAIERAVAGRASVRPAATRDAWADSALLLVRVVVLALMVVAILVAALVCYSALSLFVDRRTPELALLRTAGMEAKRVRRLLYLDAALLALFGAGVGALLGRFVAAGLLGGLSWLSDFLQGVELSHLEFDASTSATAIAVGGVVSFLGVFIPARRAARQPPLEALLGFVPGDGAPSARGPRVWLAPALALVAALALLVPSIPPLARVAAVLGAGLAGLGVLLRWSLPQMLRLARGGLDAVLPGLGRLAGASLAARPGETALAAVCVAGVVAGVTLSLALAQSAAHSIDAWMGGLFPGGVFVTAGPIAAIEPDELISAETLRIVRETPGVRGVFDQVLQKVVYRGEQVLLFAGSTDVLARYGRLAAVRGDPQAIAAAVARGEVAVSDRFSRRFGIAEGDSVTLDTPKGPRSFRVAGLIRDYSGPAGSINLDTSVFDALWPRLGSRDLVLWTDGDPAPVISEIRRRVGDAQTLFFAYGDDLAHFASHLLRRFQAILLSVAILTAVLGGIAIWNLMLGAVSARARELALLRTIGATQRQVRTITLLDALLLAVFGGVGGIALGVCSSYPVVSEVMADAVGWSLDFSIAPLQIALLVVGLLAAAMLASLYPARLAARVPMREASGSE